MALISPSRRLRRTPFSDGVDPDHPVMVTNSKYWMGPDIIAARGVKSKVRDYGRIWDFGGKSAEICAIDWKGPKP